MKRLLWVYRAKWNTARLLLAAFVLWALVAGTPARLAMLQLDAIPDADPLPQIRELRAAGRYAEALVVCDAAEKAAVGEHAAEIRAERAAIEAEQRGVMRRLKDVARGAITGGSARSEGGPDPSLELLLGAVATDLFVIGDVRDLVIQSGRWMRGEETDTVVIALSGVGIATTLAPEIDWAPSLLKAARKAGAMTDSFALFLRKAAGEHRVADLRRVMDDSATIARHASPAGALQLMKHVDNADDAAHLASFLTRTGPVGANALRVAGSAGADMAKTAETLRTAGRVAEAAAIEKTLLKVGRKGTAGAAWLSRGGLRAMTRMHPLVGLAKAVWKGNAQALVRRALELLDPTTGWSIPAAAAWVFVELALLLRRLLPAPPRGGRAAGARPMPA